ncbi:hypothetical protein FOXYSP1_07672 [Fusarium oxysporum f. sp. phaseoli]
MPSISLTHNSAILNHLAPYITTETHTTKPTTQSYNHTHDFKPLLSRALHKLHRRDTAPEIIGIVVGLTLLAAIIGVGLFVWNWNIFRQLKVSRSQRHNRRRHSHRRRHIIGHFNASVEDDPEYVELESRELHHRHRVRHHPNCRHHRLHHGHRHHRSGPRRPEPIFQMPNPCHLHPLHPPNEMDAPQIHDGLNNPFMFGHRWHRRDRDVVSVC